MNKGMTNANYFFPTTSSFFLLPQAHFICQAGLLCLKSVNLHFQGEEANQNEKVLWAANKKKKKKFICFYLHFLVRMEVDGWDPNLEEELGVSLDELRKWIEEAVEKSEIVQTKKAQLVELKKWVEQKEEEEALTEKLLSDANQ